MSQNKKEVKKATNGSKHKQLNGYSNLNSVTNNKKKNHNVSTNNKTANSKSIQTKSFLADSRNFQDKNGMYRTGGFSANKQVLKRDNSNGKVKSAATSRKKMVNNDKSVEKGGSANKQKYQNKLFEQIINKKSIQLQKQKQMNGKRSSESTAYQTISHNKPSLNPELVRDESQRLQNLQKYLNENNEKIGSLKKASDQHVLNQLSLSQQNLQTHLIAAEDETRKIIKKHGIEIQNLHRQYEIKLEGKQRQIDSLKIQLKQQKQLRVKSDIKVKQNEVLIKGMKQKLTEREKQMEKIRQILAKQMEERKIVEEKLSLMKGEKMQMRQMAEGVLAFVREQIRHIQS